MWAFGFRRSPFPDYITIPNRYIDPWDSDRQIRSTLYPGGWLQWNSTACVDSVNMELQVGAFWFISGAETKLTDLMRTTLRIEINESRQGGARLSHRWFWIIHEHTERLLYSRMIRSYCNDDTVILQWWRGGYRCDNGTRRRGARGTRMAWKPTYSHTSTGVTVQSLWECDA